MKQCKLAVSLFLCASLVSTASLAQLSLKGEVLPVAATYNWTGFYAGLNAGIVNHTMDITDNQAASFLATIHQVTNPRFTGGFQVGYRRQLEMSSASGVYGVEVSADFADASFQRQYGSPFALYQLSSQNSLKTLCLLQLMGGIAADRVLLFLAAGMSWTNIEGNVTSLIGLPFFNSFNVSKKQVGGAFGGGLEYAFTDALSARVKVDAIMTDTYTATDGTGNHYMVANSIMQGTVGVNYKFL